jgi:hypothetical protein
MQCLTEEMRSEWVEKGYIHLKGVLDSDEVAGYLAAADAVIADYRAANPEVWEQDAFINRPGRRARAYYEPQDQRDIILAGIADPA